MTNEHLNDHIIIGNTNKVVAILKRMELHFRRVGKWIPNHIERTAKAVILHRLLWAAANYLHIASENVDGHVSALALATRNLYELRLRTEYMIAFPANFSTWQAEVATDKIELLEGILGIQKNGENPEKHAVLKEEIVKIRQLLNKHSLKELKSIPSTASIAKELDKKDEHKSLFKLFSKLVHPSSLLVNDYDNFATQEAYQILQVHCQLYAWDIFTRTCNALAVPEDVRSFDFLMSEQEHK